MQFDRNKLIRALHGANAARVSKDLVRAREHLFSALRELNVPLREDSVAALRATLDDRLEHPARRLAVYGTLAPGKSNHHVIADIRGRWYPGTVEGTLHEEGWGATLRFPGMLWKPGCGSVAVEVLESDELPRHWHRLDAFEGDEYARILVPVEKADASFVVANVYTVHGPA